MDVVLMVTAVSDCESFAVFKAGDVIWRKTQRK